MTSPMVDPFARAAADADALRTRTGVDRFAAVVVLGSGLGAFADAWPTPRCSP